MLVSFWQGCDDSVEVFNVLCLFQIIVCVECFVLQEMFGDIVLFGFVCDEGVWCNKGCIGVVDGLVILCWVLVNMVSYQGYDCCVDMGIISVDGEQLEVVYQVLCEVVVDCQWVGKCMLVLGGGYEMVFGYGVGVLDVFLGEKVGIINFDVYLDLCFVDCVSFGMLFCQLVLECDVQQCGFYYICIGVSWVVNIQVLWDEVVCCQVVIVEDLEVLIVFEICVLLEFECNIV